MKHIDQKMLSDIWIVLRNNTCRDMLKLIGVDGALKYKEMMNHIKAGSGKTAYYVRAMTNSNMIKKDNITKRYFLTRIGIESLVLIEAFDEICTKFDISDCDADGRVETKIVIVGREEPEKQKDVKCLLCTHTAKSVKGIKIHHRRQHGEILAV